MNGKSEFGRIISWGSASDFAKEATWGSTQIPKGWIPVSVIWKLGDKNCGVLFADKDAKHWIIGFNRVIRSIAPREAKQIVLETEVS